MSERGRSKDTSNLKVAWHRVVVELSEDCARFAATFAEFCVDDAQDDENAERRD